MKMVICAAYGCYITDLTREKERGFPFSPFLTQGLYQKRSILQLAIQNWDRMDSEELLI